MLCPIFRYIFFFEDMEAKLKVTYSDCGKILVKRNGIIFRYSEVTFFIPRKYLNRFEWKCLKHWIRKANSDLEG